MWDWGFGVCWGFRFLDGRRKCVRVCCSSCKIVIFGNFKHNRMVSIDDKSVLRCVVVCCHVLPCVAVCCSVLQCVAVCCHVLQCVAVCCSVLQCVAM